MTPVSSCPDPRQWHRLLCERLPDDEAERLEQHLSECTDCLRTVRGVSQEGDTLVEAIRGRPPEADVPEGLRLLIRRLKELRPDADTESPVTRSDSWPTPPTDAGPEATEQGFDFLAPPQQPDEIGRLGPYRVLRALGSGGMGVVFEAEDPDLRRLVALKVMKPGLAAGDAARKRFLREARAAAALDHDHIVKIYQVGEDRGVPYIAMQLLRGQSLHDRLRDGRPLPPAEAVRIGRELAEGLAAAHEAGLVHRDVKPANVWLEEPRGRVKILDFGLARPEMEDAHLTQSGAVVGTPAFMAPEAARGRPVGPRSDLFSLGCVLYRLLTGEVPFKGVTTMAVLLSLAEDQPPPPHALNPEVPPDLSDLVMRLLSKDPDGRPPSARAAIEALDGIGREGTVLVAPPPAVRRRRRLADAIAAATLLLAGGVLVAGIVIRIYDKEGKKIAEVEVPEGGSYKIDGLPPGPATAPVETGKKVVPPVAGPLDRLDPSKIPAEDRFDWQPKELVAVLGEHHMRHFGPVKGVAYSGDGKLIASATDDGYVSLWDAATMRRLALLPVAKYGGDRIALSPARNLLVCLAANYGTLRLLDVTDPARPKEVGKPLAPPAGKAFGPPAFSPDGAVLAVPCLSDGTIHLWDVTGDPKELPLLKGHEGQQVQRLAFPPAGEKNARVLFSYGIDKTIRRWDLGADPVAGRVVLEDVKGPVYALAVSPDGNTVAIGPHAAWRVWDVSGEPAKEAPYSQKGQGLTNAIAFSGDGHWAATGHTFGFALWDLSAKPEAQLTTIPQTSHVSAVAFAPDGKTLVTGGIDGTVRQWALNDGAPKERFPLHGHTNAITDVAFVPGERSLYSASTDGTVRSWDLGAAPPREQSVFALKATALQPALLAVNGKSARVAVQALSVAAARFWDLGGPEPRELEIVPGLAWLALSADGSTAAYYLRNAGNEKVVLLDLRGDKPVKQELANGGPVSTLALSPDGRLLACGGEDKDKAKPNLVRVWDLAARPKPKLLTLTPLAFARGSVAVLAFSADSRQLVAAGSEPGLQLWALPPDGKAPVKELLVIREGSAWRTLSFSPDGKMLACTTSTGRLAVLDATAGWQQQHAWDFPAPVGRAAFAGDGRHLAVGNANGTVYVLRLSPEKK